jgi:hypothetical protein
LGRFLAEFFDLALLQCGSDPSRRRRTFGAIDATASRGKLAPFIFRACAGFHPALDVG